MIVITEKDYCTVLYIGNIGGCNVFVIRIDVIVVKLFIWICDFVTLRITKHRNLMPSQENGDHKHSFCHDGLTSFGHTEHRL